MNDKRYDKVVGNALLSIGNEYLKNVVRIDMTSSFTLKEAQDQINKANLTHEVCLSLLDALIVSRFDYIIDERVEYLVSKRELK